MKKKVLYSTKWLQLLELSDPDAGINGYICSHAEWANGKAIAVLPFRKTKEGDDEVLVRYEVVPCWGAGHSPCSITGGMDVEGESSLSCAKRELEEESGYSCDDDSRWFPLGQSYLNKASTTVVDLFAVDLTDIEPGEAVGDGTQLEAEGYCEWVSEVDGLTQDPLVETMIYRLIRRVF